MKTISLNRLSGGRTKALTLSYDDGTIHDRRLVEILNRHGLRGTFHLNSGRFDQEGMITAREVAELFRGHEVSVHTVTHPHLEDLPAEAIVREIRDDRAALEDLVGYPVRGMSYPYGTYDSRVVAMLPSLGIEYARTVHSHARFDMPRDLLLWPATCHHKNNLLELGEKFIASNDARTIRLLYVWGHSYEFDRNANWDLIEGFASAVGGRDDVWYATNIEIADYITALRALRFSAACDMVLNPSARPVWISVEGAAVELPPGQTTRL